jgi:TonB family protein
VGGDPGSVFGQLGESLKGRGATCDGCLGTISMSIGVGGGFGRAQPYDRDVAVEAFAGRGKRVPRIGCGGPKIGCRLRIDGPADPAVIRRVVRNHINEVRHCYNEALSGDPTVAGRVEITFLIGPEGRVPSAIVSQNATGDADVAQCIVAAVKRWRFPTSGGTARVSYPFMLDVV